MTCSGLVRSRIAPLQGADTSRELSCQAICSRTQFWSQRGTALDDGLDELSSHATERAERSDDDSGDELASLATRAAAMRNDIAELAEMSEAAKFVYWGEVTGERVMLRGSAHRCCPQS